MKLVKHLFFVIFLFVTLPVFLPNLTTSAYADVGTFTASNVSYNPITEELIFDASDYSSTPSDHFTYGNVAMRAYPYEHGFAYISFDPDSTCYKDHCDVFLSFDTIPRADDRIIIDIWDANILSDFQSQVLSYNAITSSFPTPTPTQLTSLSPAKIWVGLKNSDDVGVKFDLKAEAYANSTLVSSGEVDSVIAGSSGFNNAKLDTINFNSFSPVDFPSGTQLSVKLYVRNACSESGHNSGVARLWYNDSQATSAFDATIGSTDSNYYLVSSAVLSTSVGSGPKQTVDVQSGAKCSAFKSFGTWTITP